MAAGQGQARYLLGRGGPNLSATLVEDTSDAVWVPACRPSALLFWAVRSALPLDPRKPNPNPANGPGQVQSPFPPSSPPDFVCQLPPPLPVPTSPPAPSPLVSFPFPLDSPIDSGVWRASRPEDLRLQRVVGRRLSLLSSCHDRPTPLVSPHSTGSSDLPI